MDVREMARVRSALVSGPGKTFQRMSSSVVLQWTDNSNNEDGFTIERKEGRSGTYTKIGATGANVNVYEDSSLQFGKIHCYRVIAYNSGGDSGYSSEKCATTLATPVLSSP